MELAHRDSYFIAGSSTWQLLKANKLERGQSVVRILLNHLFMGKRMFFKIDFC